MQHLEHLLFYGAEMIAQNASGNTALHLCALYNQVRTPTNTYTHILHSQLHQICFLEIYIFVHFLSKRNAVVYILVMYIYAYDVRMACYICQNV